MAERVKPADGKKGEGVSAIRGNGFDSEAVRSFVERVENVQAHIDEKMQAARDLCAPLREDIDEIKKEVAEAGIPRREFNAVISKRRKLRAAEACRDRLSEEQQQNFDQLEKSLGMLGDTPLGAAALAAAKPAEAAATTH